MAEAVMGQKRLIVKFVSAMLQHANFLAPLTVSGEEPRIQLFVLGQLICEQLLRAMCSPWSEVARLFPEEHHVNRLGSMP